MNVRNITLFWQEWALGLEFLVALALEFLVALALEFLDPVVWLEFLDPKLWVESDFMLWLEGLEGESIFWLESLDPLFVRELSESDLSRFTLLRSLRLNDFFFFGGNAGGWKQKYSYHRLLYPVTMVATYNVWLHSLPGLTYYLNIYWSTQISALNDFRESPKLQKILKLFPWLPWLPL